MSDATIKRTREGFAQRSTQYDPKAFVHLDFAAIALHTMGYTSKKSPNVLVRRALEAYASHLDKLLSIEDPEAREMAQLLEISCVRGSERLQVSIVTTADILNAPGSPLKELTKAKLAANKGKLPVLFPRRRPV